MASYVKSAADGVQGAAKSTADTVLPYTGETVANAIKTGGDYSKAGIEKAGEVLGFKEVNSQKAAIRVSHG